MKNFPLLTAFLCAPCFIITLQAQSVTDEQAMRVFARDFMAAYNRQDATALQAMYTTDAVSIDANGKVTNGADSIAQLFADQFISKEATLLVRQIGLTWSDAQHAFVATGTYEGYGLTYVYDIPFRQTTAYRNTMIYENRQWKIARSVVTPLVKTIMYQETASPAKWKSALTDLLHGSGILSFEMGTSPDNPNTLYALLEWPSMEVAQVFFKDPNWHKALRQAGRNAKPLVVFLDDK